MMQADFSYMDLLLLLRGEKICRDGDGGTTASWWVAKERMGWKDRIGREIKKIFD